MSKIDWNNQEEVRKYNKEYQRKYVQDPVNKERARKRNQKHYHNNRSKLSEVKREYHISLRKRVLAYLGGKCIRCGFSDERALHIDHINGGGKAEFKHGGRNRSLLDILSGKRNDLQLLCANCNFIKRIENNEIKRHV